MPNPDDIAARLQPTHLMGALNEPTDELKRRAEEAVKALPTAEDEKKARMRERLYTFEFKFTSKAGEEFSGTFTSKVPDVKTRGLIGVLRAQLGGGIPYSAMDPFTNELNLVVATLTFVLADTKDMPGWAKDLRAIIDADVLFALYEEVSAHETTFLGR